MFRKRLLLGSKTKFIKSRHQFIPEPRFCVFAYYITLEANPAFKIPNSRPQASQVQLKVMSVLVASEE
jgi:hypothetical protein